MGGWRTLVVLVLAGAVVALLFVVTLTDKAPVEGSRSQSQAVADPSGERCLLWNGDFETGDLDQWPVVLRKSPEGLAVVNSPVRQGRHAARFTVPDSDVLGANPRAQLNAPGMHGEGDEHFIGWSTYFPSDFPSIPSGAWFVFFQFHGEPYSGSPALGFGVGWDGRIELRRDKSYGHDRVWSEPLVRGRWTDFTARVKWSKDPSVGFVELWVDGERQMLSGSGTRLHMATMQDDQDVVESIATNYRKGGAILEPVTIMHDAVKIGTSRSVVQAEAPAAPCAATDGSADAP